MHKFQVLLLISSVFLYAKSDLPNYINKCKIQEDFTDCFKANIQPVREHIKDGIEEIGIPPLSPLKWSNLNIDVENSFTVKLTNVEIYYLHEFEILDMKVVMSPRRSNMHLHFDKIRITGSHDTSGRIRGHAINGRGLADILLENYSVDFSFTPTIIHKNGADYISIAKQSSQMKSRPKMTITLGNLTDNVVFKGNWQSVEEPFRKAIVTSFNAVLQTVLKGIATQKPIPEFFNVA